ncbi:hypothetical protein E4U46_004941, partial [Claviceps purpurea]
LEADLSHIFFCSRTNGASLLLYRQGIDGRPYRFSQAVTYPSKFTFLNQLANGQIDIESASLVVV